MIDPQLLGIIIGFAGACVLLGGILVVIVLSSERVGVDFDRESTFKDAGGNRCGNCGFHYEMHESIAGERWCPGVPVEDSDLAAKAAAAVGSIEIEESYSDDDRIEAIADAVSERIMRPDFVQRLAEAIMKVPIK